MSFTGTLKVKMTLFTAKSTGPLSVRFAPSPTGVFHVGNLRTAWISHRIARKLGMEWVVRYEDIDGPRVVAGAREKQREDMRALGLVADRELLQSEFHARHLELFERAGASGDVYPCSCSRKEIQDELARMASAPHSKTANDAVLDPVSGASAEPIYNGRCRERAARPERSNPTLAWRFRNPADSSGAQDFIIGRTDPAGQEFAPGYHWACAIDDFDGGHRLLVRAWDLAHAIAYQREVFRWVAKREGASDRDYPAVFHCSLVTSDDGHRLEKRTRGVTLDELLARGRDSAAILAAFERSFEASIAREAPAGRIWGEDLKELKLSRLGLAPA